MTASLSRRHVVGGLAAISASAAAFGLVRPALARPGAGRRLNIYSWKGYDSAAVLEPFRAEHNCRIGVETLTSDPEAVSRLRGGETAIWDLIAVNCPWPRKVMLPEGLILPLDADRYAGHAERALPALRRRGRLFGMEDGTVHGLAQRFSPFGFSVNTDRISKTLAEDAGFSLFLEPAMRGRYAVLGFDSWNVTHTCIAAGIDPFRPHDPGELDLFGATARRILAGAALRSDDIGVINRALASGAIDACFSASRSSVSAARLDGRTELQGIVPRHGPIGGKGGVLWVEITSVVNNPQVSPLAFEFLDYVQRPETARRIAMAAEFVNPVAQMGDPGVFARFSARELDALQWDSLDGDLDRCADYDINPDYGQMLALFNAAKRQAA